MEEFLYRLMLKYNEWWRTKGVPEEFLPETRREKFFEALSFMDKPQMITIVGPRRTGKTTIVYQLIDKLIKGGVDPNRILFFSFDEVPLDRKIEKFELIFDMYTRRILEEQPRDFKATVYLFIDEVHYLAFWPSVLKRYYDLKYKLKFVVTGSCGPVIFQKTKESLAGRSVDVHLKPLSFREYLALKKVGIETPDRKRSFIETIENLPRAFRRLAPFEASLKMHFEEYLLKGGFPEVIDQDSDFIQKYVFESIIERTLYKDFAQAFNIREPNILLNILRYAAERSGDIFEVLSLSKNFGVSRQVIANYLAILNNGGLIYLLELYGRSVIKKARKAKKIYIADPALANSLLKLGKDIFLDKPYLGRIVETVCVLNTAAACRKIGFWRNEKNREVDIVVSEGKEIIPIEVKYSQDVAAGDVAGLLAIMDEYKKREGYVISGGRRDSFTVHGKTIHCVPAWIWCLAI